MSVPPPVQPAMHTLPPLRFMTCGSVDDGKSTLIGRLLVDSKAVLQDQLSAVQRKGETDLALLTDGLSAEREQGITIDVAYRYFATPQRKFTIADAPGHDQYTRNMVTAASNSDAAVVLVDATKLNWKEPGFELLPQTRRHAYLANLLRVPSIIFAVNKLDALGEEATESFNKIQSTLCAFSKQAAINLHGVLPISALRGDNVVHANPGFAGYNGPSLLTLLEQLPNLNLSIEKSAYPFALPVQWVEVLPDAGQTQHSRRVLWGRVATGVFSVGQDVVIFPSGKQAKIVQLLGVVRQNLDRSSAEVGQSLGVVLDKEVGVSRGDYLLPPGFNETVATKTLVATVIWMDDTPLEEGRWYWALHGHRWVKAQVEKVDDCLNIHTLETNPAHTLAANEIGHVRLVFQEAVPSILPYKFSRTLGAMILVDPFTNKTAGAVLINNNV